MKQETYTVFQAAKQLQVSSNWIRILIWEDKFPGAFKDSFNRWQIPARDLELVRQRQEVN